MRNDKVPKADSSGGHHFGSRIRMQKVGGWNKPLNSFFNREISWLAFNARVLSLAADETIPLLERVRFLAIFSSNLDEFFQVRVAGLMDQVEAGITKRSHDGHTAGEQLKKIRQITLKLCAQQQRLFARRIHPSLESEGIYLTTIDQLDIKDRTLLRSYFENRVLPVLTPLAVDHGHPFPFISDLSLNLAVSMRDPVNNKNCFARVKVPSMLERWVAVDESDNFVAQEEVIAAHMDLLFSGMELIECHAFRVTRNADLIVDDEETADLLAAVEMELRRRRSRKAVRLEISDSVSSEMCRWLLRELDLKEDSLYLVSGPVDLTGLSAISALPRDDLKWPQWQGITEPELAQESGTEKQPDLFAVLRKGDVLVHHPYSSFSSSVGELIHQACIDKKVLAIKMTIYRTSDSPILDALTRAAEKGKQVAVLVELKARFDEAANISWARRLEQAGAHVTYGLAGLKIHAKIAMIIREEIDGIKRYCHIGTGNYNPDTATLYEDLGLLTSDHEIGTELASLFNQLTGYGRDISYGRLIVAPGQLRSRIIDLIKKEAATARDQHPLNTIADQPIDLIKKEAATANASREQEPVEPRADNTDDTHLPRTGSKAHIIMKMNALVDPQIIEQLYKASQAGVKIDLIVRSQCCLRPGVPGLSENITVRSIVGRYLEHSRIYYFANARGPNRSEVYIGSADLMTRNLDHRVETLVQIDDTAIKNRIHGILNACLNDNDLSWTLDSTGTWSQCTDHDKHQRNLEAEDGEERNNADDSVSSTDIHSLMHRRTRARSRGLALP